jgi:hypothetical protein
MVFAACGDTGSGSSSGGGDGGGNIPPLPAKVSNLARTLDSGEVTLTWIDPTDEDFASVEITWTWAGGNGGPATVDAGTETYTASGLTDGTVYVFTVTAMYMNGEGGSRTISSAFNMTEIGGYLNSASGGDTTDAPIFLPVGLDLSIDRAALLSAINTKNKYVDLDLSNCTMSGTVFDPGTGTDGVDKVVSLALPDVAKSIKEEFYIGDYSTFENFTNLTSVSGKNIVTVDELVFKGHTKLATVSFPKATTIDYSAFYGCTALETVELPAVETISNDVFYGCTALEEVSLPLSTT